jgi:metallo-beta-lactamase family protein
LLEGKNMKINFCGGVGTVTGSCYLIETEVGKILVDCGMFQGNKNLKMRNFQDFIFDPSQIDAVLITHAHIDHIGLLPKLVRAGYKGPIYAVESTAEIMEVLLYDTARIQESDAEWLNKKRNRTGKDKIVPLYIEEDVTKTLEQIKKVSFHKEFNPIPNIRITYKDAGHILGSGFLEMYITENNIEKKIIFSGDLGRLNQAIIKDPETSSKADVILIESTYGNRSHKTTEDTTLELVNILKEVSQTKGTLLIPAFALGRTQEIIYKFFELFDKHQIPEMPIYIDSPMAQKITAIYAKNQNLYDEETLNYFKAGKNPLDFSELIFCENKEESMKLNDMPGPKVIVSSSGMCDAGRIQHHLKHNIWKSDTHILFVGYQGEETLGRKLVEGAKRVNILGEFVQVNAKIHTIGGLSAHAGQDELLNWLKMFEGTKPQVFVVHGEPAVAKIFSESVKKEIGLNTYIPDWKNIAYLTFEKDKVEIKLKAEEKVIVVTIDQLKKWENTIKKVDEYVSKLDKSKIKDKDYIKNMVLKRINSSVEEILDMNQDLLN